jgi:hypothetical protein
MARALPILSSPFALEELQIASPCPAEWNDMVGDERVRFCGLCDKNVYNLSGLTRREATALVTDREGSVCIRMFRRADGTVLTSDCPVGVRAAVHRARREVLFAAATTVAAVTALLAFLGGSFTKKACARLTDVRTTIVEQAHEIPVPEPLTGAPPPLPPATPVMGGVAMPPPSPPSPPSTPLMGKVAPPERPTMGEAVAPSPRTGRIARPH